MKRKLNLTQLTMREKLIEQGKIKGGSTPESCEGDPFIYVGNQAVTICKETNVAAFGFSY